MNKCYISTSGWSYNHWASTFYPKGIPSNEWLQFIAAKFNTVEVNMSFYRTPSEKILMKWREKTPDDFIFVIKMNRFITHLLKLKNVEEPLRRNIQRYKLLGNKLGVILHQLPPSLKKDIGLLKDFLELLPKDIRHAVEFRNDTWICKETFTILEKFNVAYCIVSAPKLKCELRVTSNFSYIRFHGVDKWYKYNYTDKELEWWAEKICSFMKKGIDVFAYFNNDFEAYAPFNALRLRELVNAKIRTLNLLPYITA